MNITAHPGYAGAYCWILNRITCKHAQSLTALTGCYEYGKFQDFWNKKAVANDRC